MNICGETIGGRYTLNREGVIKRASITNLNWNKETIKFSVRREEKWPKEEIPMLTSSCLYVRKGGSENESYIVSIIKNIN